MAGMFGFASAFNQDLELWNVPAETDQTEMFTGSGVAVEDLPTWYVAPPG
jgi:hypothetical protein